LIKKKLIKILLAAGIIATLFACIPVQHHKISTVPQKPAVVQETKIFQNEIRKVSKLVTYEGNYELTDRVQKNDWLSSILPKEVYLDLMYDVSYTYDTSYITVLEEKGDSLSLAIDSTKLQLSPLALDAPKSTMNNSKSLIYRTYDAPDMQSILADKQLQATEAVSKDLTFRQAAKDGLVENLRMHAHKLGFKNVQIVDQHKLTAATMSVAKQHKLKIGIDMGHNVSTDTGANSIKSEDALTKEVGTKLIQKLRNSGYDVVDCTPTNATSVVDSLMQRADTANKNNVDLYISIHFNCSEATSAKGTEVWIYNDKTKEYATNILKHFEQSGYVNRGVKYQGKDGKRLFVLNNTKAPAMLIECSFVSSTDDMEHYNADNIANNINLGIIEINKTL
jgi:N-acetylmuramoyl-L-alanine amidase